MQTKQCINISEEKKIVLDMTVIGRQKRRQKSSRKIDIRR